MRYLSFLLIFLLSGSLFGIDNLPGSKMKLNADGLDKLEINCGAGFLVVKGKAGLSEIRVTAKIIVDGVDEQKANEIIRDNLELSLKKQGRRAVLVSRFKNSSFVSLLNKINKQVDLTVTIPNTLNLDVDDGSGSIEISNINGNVKVNDGSGAMEIVNVKGRLDIVDGSGNLSVYECKEAVDIDDGSGSIVVENVLANVKIEDGSGGIEMKNIGGDVKIHDSSGEIDVRDVAGSVEIYDGSGSIDINSVQKDVVIKESGSGGLRIKNVDGKVIKDE